MLRTSHDAVHQMEDASDLQALAVYWLTFTIDFSEMAQHRGNASWCYILLSASHSAAQHQTPSQLEAGSDRYPHATSSCWYHFRDLFSSTKLEIFRQAWPLVSLRPYRENARFTIPTSPQEPRPETHGPHHGQRHPDCLTQPHMWP